MKNKLIWLIIILIAIAIIFSLVDTNSNPITEEFKPLEVNPGDEFTYIDYECTMYVLNYTIEDVTGDTTKDMVIVVGEKSNAEETTSNNMDIVIYEPNESKFYNLKLKKFNGQLPKIVTKDLTGDGILDIVVTTTDENENIAVRIASLQNGNFAEIFKTRDNKGITFTGNFIDGFKAYLKCTKYKKEANIDLADRKENYITNGFFDESGRLLKTDIKVKTTGFTSVDFVQLDGYFGIQTTQHVIGFNNEDLLDEIITIWKYENGKWCVKEAKGNNVGNLLY